MVQSAVRQVYALKLLCRVNVYVGTCIWLKLGKSTKTHLYWTMKNCGGDADQLRSGILNIVKHYQVHYCVSNVQDIGD